MKTIKLQQTIKNKLQVPQNSFLERKKKVSFNFHQLLLSNLCLWVTRFMFWQLDSSLRPFFVFKICKIIFHFAAILLFLTMNSAKES